MILGNMYRFRKGSNCIRIYGPVYDDTGRLSPLAVVKNRTLDSYSWRGLSTIGVRRMSTPWTICLIEGLVTSLHAEYGTTRILVGWPPQESR